MDVELPGMLAYIQEVLSIATTASSWMLFVATWLIFQCRGQNRKPAFKADERQIVAAGVACSSTAITIKYQKVGDFHWRNRWKTAWHQQTQIAGEGLKALSGCTARNVIFIGTAIFYSGDTVRAVRANRSDLDRGPRCGDSLKDQR